MENEITQKAFDEIAKEVGGLTDNVKALKSSMDKDLADLRALTAADNIKGIADSVLREQAEKIATSVAEKNAALEAVVKAQEKRADELEKRLNRQGFGGSAEKNEKKAAEAAEFERHAMVAKGQLRVGIDVDETKVDVDGYAHWEKMFPMYLRRDEKALDTKSMYTASDPDGGYLVPVAVGNRILKIVYESNSIRPLATVETIGTDSIEFPVDEGQFGYGWIGEQVAPTETTTSQTGTQRIAVHEMYAEPRATQKLLEDASVDVEAWITGKVGERFARVEADAFVNGDGVQQPRGILTYSSGTSRGTVEQVVSGAAAGVTADGLFNLVYGLKSAYSNGSSFLMRRSTILKLMLLKDGNGQYLWRPGLQDGQPSNLLGYAVYETAEMPAVTANALAIAYGNWKQAYTVVDRLGITALRDALTAKPFVKFYFRRRVGGDVVNFEAFKIQKIST